MIQSIPKAFRLSPSKEKAVMQYLADGLTSAREISEKLIEHHGADNKRFLTGKADVYIHVCFFLDSLVDLGVAKFMTGDSDDRIYKFK
ncbi:DUF3895 domain-containing protein [Paenibacillus larvae]|uniref:Uncharacterized protein n=1 Tax=Paenibacillus larvae subsp. larvae TaxID=147375 RepID=A0A6C0QYU9_9BACL|nr:DUF3895 domain-containing protein [Paenibacillus larvae]QHZ53376.1 hypothetical protein ERICV_04325 [Paenibacillus larvae subsp. larvae]